MTSHFRHLQGRKRGKYKKKHLTGNAYYAAKAQKNFYYQDMGRKGGRPRIFNKIDDINQIKILDDFSDYLGDQDKMNYFAENFRTEKAGGGIAGIRRPWAIPPESGPMPQGGGLSSQYNRVKKLTE